MSMRLDADKTAKNAACAIVERIFVEKIARGVRRDVILQSAGVEFLFALATETASRSLRPPSPIRRLKLSKRE